MITENVQRFADVAAVTHLVERLTPPVRRSFHLDAKRLIFVAIKNWRQN
jgi:hypothetical protein